jgi:hypothetical protein
MKKPPAFTKGRVPPLAHYLKVTPQIKAHAIKALREWERRQQPLNQGVKP